MTAIIEILRYFEILPIIVGAITVILLLAVGFLIVRRLRG